MDTIDIEIYLFSISKIKLKSLFRNIFAINAYNLFHLLYLFLYTLLFCARDGIIPSVRQRMAYCNAKTGQQERPYCKVIAFVRRPTPSSSENDS